jgi:hypothetical protein
VIQTQNVSLSWTFHGCNISGTFRHFFSHCPRRESRRLVSLCLIPRSEVQRDRHRKLRAFFSMYMSDRVSFLFVGMSLDLDVDLLQGDQESFLLVGWVGAPFPLVVSAGWWVGDVGFRRLKSIQPTLSLHCR